MTEYIDKHEAYLLLKDLEAAYIYPPVKEAYATAARHIDQMKAADVQPVKRGRWIRIDDEYGHDYVCSECNDKNDRKSHYCPNCGARMDLKKG